MDAKWQELTLYTLNLSYCGTRDGTTSLLLSSIDAKWKELVFTLYTLNWSYFGCSPVDQWWNNVSLAPLNGWKVTRPGFYSLHTDQELFWLPRQHHCYKTFQRIPPPSPDDAGLILLGTGKWLLHIVREFAPSATEVFVDNRSFHNHRKFQAIFTMKKGRMRMVGSNSVPLDY